MISAILSTAFILTIIMFLTVCSLSTHKEDWWIYAITYFILFVCIISIMIGHPLGYVPLDEIPGWIL